MRRLKILGFATVPLLILAAYVGVPAAYGKAASFQNEEYFTFLKAKPSTELVISEANALPYECGLEASGEKEGAPAAEIELDAMNSTCAWYEEEDEAILEANGCRLGFKAGTITSGGRATGNMYLSCPPSKSLEIVNSTCTLIIPAQTGIGPVSYRTVGSGDGREVEIELTGDDLIDESVGKSILCKGSGHSEITGSWMVKGKNLAGAPVGVSIDEAEPLGPVGLFVGNNGPGVPGTIEAESYPATISGQQETPYTLSFETNGGSVECENVQFEAGLYEASGTVPVYATYHGCEVAGLAGVVRSNGCHYVLHAGESIGEKTFAATVDLVCNGKGEAIEVEAASGGSTLCAISIGEQFGYGVIHLENVGKGSGRYISANLSIANIRYSMSGVFCNSESADNGVLSTNGGSIEAHGEA